MKYGNDITFGFAAAAIAIFAILIIAVGLGIQYFCVRFYAPWMLDTNDKQAIAFMCSSNCNK